MIASKPFLDAVVEFTSQKEHSALAASLVNSIHQLLDVEQVILLVLGEHLTAMELSIVATDGKYLQEADSNPDAFLLEFGSLVSKCKEQDEPLVLQTPHYTRVVIKMAFGGRADHYLAVKDFEWTEHRLSIVQGMVQVYQNFYRTIAESEHDGLTGLLNRKFFDERISKIHTHAQELKRGTARKNDRREDIAEESYWLCIFDLDHFKKVNDELGHAFGDEVLILISNILKESFRTTDLLFRYGGEEFIIVIGPSSKEVAISLFNKFRQKVANKEFNNLSRVTVSMGVVEVDPREIPINIVGHADQALYYAKNHGRNQLAVYEDLIKQDLLKVSKVSEDIELF